MKLKKKPIIDFSIYTTKILLIVLNLFLNTQFINNLLLVYFWVELVISFLFILVYPKIKEDLKNIPPNHIFVDVLKGVSSALSVLYAVYLGWLVVAGFLLFSYFALYGIKYSDEAHEND